MHKNVLLFEAARIIKDSVLEVLHNPEAKLLSLSNILLQSGNWFAGFVNNAIIIYPNTWLYRARVVNKDECKIIQDISYPPVGKQKKGRADIMGTQTFYCSNDFRTLFYETDIKVNERVVIGAWKAKESIIANCIGMNKEVYQLLQSSRKDYPYGTDGIQWDRIAKNSTVNYMNQELNQVILESLGIVFTRSKNDSVTRMIANLFCNVSSKLQSKNILTNMDGIAYPTVAMWGNADNFALSKDCVDNKLECISVREFCVIDVKDTKISYDVSAQALPSENTLMWQKGKPVWKIRENGGELRLVDTLGPDKWGWYESVTSCGQVACWKAYDSSGEEVDPVID